MADACFPARYGRKREQRRGPYKPRRAAGDRPRLGGDRFAPLSADQRGNEADLRPLRGDRREAPVCWDDPGYDRAANHALVETIRVREPDAVILFNDPQLAREGLIRPCAGHDNHLHIRF